MSTGTCATISRPSLAQESFGHIELAQHRALLSHVRLHALQNVIEYRDCLTDVRPLVEHDAFGALAHRGIGNFRARRKALLRKTLEYLRGPDYRYVRCFAHPENL